MACKLNTSLPLSAVLSLNKITANITDGGNVLLKKSTGKKSWTIPGLYGVQAAIFQFFSTKMRRPIHNDLWDLPTSQAAEDSWAEFENWYEAQTEGNSLGTQFIPGSIKTSNEVVTLSDNLDEDGEPRPIIPAEKAQVWAVPVTDPGVFACKQAFKNARMIVHKEKKYLAYYWYPGAAKKLCPDLSLLTMPTIINDTTGLVRVPKPRAAPEAKPKEKKTKEVESEKKKKSDVKETPKKKKDVKPANTGASSLTDKCAMFIYREAAKLNNEKLMQVAKLVDRRAHGDESAAVNLRMVLTANTGPLAELQKTREVSVCKATLLTLKKFVKEFTLRGEPQAVPFQAYLRKCMVLSAGQISNFCFLLLQCATAFNLCADFSVSERRSAADLLFEAGDSSSEEEGDSDPEEDPEDENDSSRVPDEDGEPDEFEAFLGFESE